MFFSGRLNCADEFKLSDFIDGVDVVDAFGLKTVALMDRVNTDKAGAALGLRFLALADSNTAMF